MAKKSNRRRTLLSDIYLSSLNKLPSIDRSKEASSFVRAGGPYERSGYAQRAYINIRRSERTIRRKVPTSRRTCSLSSRSGFVRNVNDGKFEKKKNERKNERAPSAPRQSASNFVPFRLTQDIQPSDINVRPLLRL